MHATQEEWNKVVSAAYRRHMMAPVGAKAWYEGSGRITFECCEELKFLPTCVMPWPKRSSGKISPLIPGKLTDRSMEWQLMAQLAWCRSQA